MDNGEEVRNWIRRYPSRTDCVLKYQKNESIRKPSEHIVWEDPRCAVLSVLRGWISACSDAWSYTRWSVTSVFSSLPAASA
jgi:hypothetical protein